MKVTLNWLKQYVDFAWSPEELAERLTMLGLEVEQVQKLGGEFEGIVVAEVLSRDKHPNADKLSLCRVNDGTGVRQIVCGADNFKAGDKVPLILPGASLPLKPGETAPFTIKVGKIRGVESHGMMCSPKELGLADEADGLLILRAEARVGQPFAEYLGRAGSDVVYDLEVTPNRPDLNSLIGIAREIAALTGVPLKIPVGPADSALASTSAEPGVESFVAVRVEDAEACPRYTARVITGVKIGPSPDWMRGLLEKVGVRSINNVVDTTNYVMLEVGQPLHAFDYQLLAAGRGGDKSPPTIVVRPATAGEKFTTLDGQERNLTSGMLLIADEHKGIALAGVMGGANTEIKPSTRDVLIESACFQPANIRRTSKQLGLRSESSYRFERGADIGITDWASRRCAQLILETAGGTLARGSIDIRAREVVPKEIILRHQKVNALLGVPLRPEEIEFYLGQLGLKITHRKPRSVDETSAPEPVTFVIPTWRVDLKGEADLVEEVARLYGVDKIPSTPPRGAMGSNVFDAVYDQISEARVLLTGMGLHEAVGQTLVADAAARFTAPAEALIMLANPLSQDMSALRPSLLPGLLDSLRHNLSRKNNAVALFEIGRVFALSSAQPREERRLAIALTGPRSAPYWSGEQRDANFDLYDLKGFLEEFIEQFGLRGVSFGRRPESNPLFLEAGVIALGGKLPLGTFGQLHPVLAKKYDLRDPVFLAELNLDQMLAKRNTAKSCKPLPPFPAIRRDVAMLVADNITHEKILNAVKEARPPHLETVELFDIFRGKNIPAGQKSMAYAFIYRAPDKTLTDAEVNAAHEKVVAHFKQSLGATVRES